MAAPPSFPPLSTACDFARVGFESAATGLVVLAMDGSVLQVNRAYCELLGRSEDALRGQGHPTFGRAMFAGRLRGLAQGQPIDGAGVAVENSYVRSDGTTVWLHETLTSVQAGSPPATLLVVAARDISREKAIELENRKFKYLSDETSEAHFLINARGIIVYANNAAGLMTGFGREELLRTPIANLWEALSADSVGDLFARAARERLLAMEAVFRRKDGTTRPVRISLHVAEFGSETLLSAFVGDRSEDQRVREALRESEARLRIAVDLAQLSVYGWDPATGALSWDARLKAMWGLPPEANVNYDVFWSGVHDDDKPLVDRALKRTLDPHDGFYQAEFRVVGLRDGVERWVAACGRTFFTDGKPVGYIGAALDITERKRTEKGLEHAVAERTAELREVVSELEAFSYSISHDMRAPLRAIQGFAQILAEECCDQVSPAGQEYLRRIVTAAERMDRLIQGALVYSRLSGGEIQMEDVDLTPLINGILEAYPQFRNPGADIQVQLPLPRVRGNVAALTQCFSNLIGNAIKFVAPGVVPRVRISGEVVGRRARIAVRDNGIGIAPAAHDKIFQLFYRLDPKREGTGIGLAVAQRAAHRMNGSLSLVSAPGEGTTFTLELDAAADDRSG